MFQRWIGVSEKITFFTDHMETIPRSYPSMTFPRITYTFRLDSVRNAGEEDEVDEMYLYLEKDYHR